MQNGRQNLIAFSPRTGHINSYRLDYLSDVTMGEVYEKYDEVRAAFAELERHMWGVNAKRSAKHTEHVAFTVRVDPGERHIVERLEREKRCGIIEQTDETHYRFSAEVFDTSELVPWIRTFICRITQIDFSNRLIENQFREDLLNMYALYEEDGGEGA